MSRWIDAEWLEELFPDTGEGDWTYNATAQGYIGSAPSIDIVRCGECVYYDPPHVDDKGKRIEYKDLPEEAFDTLGIGLVNSSYGVNIGGRCCVDYNCGYAGDKRVYRAEDDFCSKGRRPLNSSEKPNNCEHITEDGVTCAKYPACDDCLDNPLNKVKGSKRLVKGSEQTDCQTCKWWSSYGYCVHRECQGYEPQTERSE